MNNVTAFIVISLFCPIIFIGIGVFSQKKKTPVHFWSNQTVEIDEISDVASYNREVGLMWLILGASLALCSLFHLLLQNIIGPLLYIVTAIIGIIMMSVKYGHIYNKYKS